MAALDEIGLDRHLVPPQVWQGQINTFGWALRSRIPGKTLVLHVRGAENDKLDAEAHQATLAVMRSRCRDRDQRIHVHCFGGGPVQVADWLWEYPRTCFGFTLDILSGSPAQKQALRSLESTQYVLETDAPYFPPPGVRFSHPHYLGAVATVVAEIRGVSPRGSSV